MSTYILILLFNISGAQPIQFQTFNSLQSCEEAKSIINNGFLSNYFGKMAPSGYGPTELKCIKQ